MPAAALTTALLVLAQASDDDETSPEIALVAFLVVMGIVIAILAVLQSRRRTVVGGDPAAPLPGEHDDEARLAFEAKMRRVEERLRAQTQDPPHGDGEPPAAGAHPA